MEIFIPLLLLVLLVRMAWRIGKVIRLYHREQHRNDCLEQHRQLLPADIAQERLRDLTEKEGYGGRD